MKTIVEASRNVNVRSVTGAIMVKRIVLTAKKGNRLLIAHQVPIN